MEKWLFSVGVTAKLEDEGYGDDQIERLTDLAMTTPSLDLLLSMAPTAAEREAVSRIYRDSLTPLSA